MWRKKKRVVQEPTIESTSKPKNPNWYPYLCVQYFCPNCGWSLSLRSRLGNDRIYNGSCPVCSNKTHSLYDYVDEVSKIQMPNGEPRRFWLGKELEKEN